MITGSSFFYMYIIKKKKKFIFHGEKEGTLTINNHQEAIMLQDITHEK